MALKVSALWESSPGEAAVNAFTENDQEEPDDDVPMIVINNFTGLGRGYDPTIADGWRHVEPFHEFLLAPNVYDHWNFIAESRGEMIYNWTCDFIVDAYLKDHDGADVSGQLANDRSAIIPREHLRDGVPDIHIVAPEVSQALLMAIALIASNQGDDETVSYTHLRAHETQSDLV